MSPQQTASNPVTTVAVSTIAVTTSSYREQTLNSQSPVSNVLSSSGYGAIGSSKKRSPDPAADDPLSGHFGVIGEIDVPSSSVTMQGTGF